MTRQPESRINDRIREELRRLGRRYYKLKGPAGWPDIYIPGNPSFHIETKQPGKHPRLRQSIELFRLAKDGCSCAVVTSEHQVKKLITWNWATSGVIFCSKSDIERFKKAGLVERFDTVGLETPEWW